MDVLMTHYKQRKTLEDSIRSLDTQLSNDDNIYLVDAGSTDGSFRILERLAYNGDIELLHRNGVSRGRGRQIAFEESDADIIAAHADLDTVFYPALKQLEATYRRLRSRNGGGLLLVHGCLVTDRSTIESVGGWSDLQVHEDKDLWVRTDRDSAIYYLPISVARHHSNFEWDSPAYRLRRRYQNYRDAIRLGVPVSALRTSYRDRQPFVARPTSSALVTAAATRAKKMKSYATLVEDHPDPREFNLRELTFRSLDASGVIDPESLPVPEQLERYRVGEPGADRPYPGKTSY